MFIRSLNLNLKDKNTKKMLIIILFALIIATFLIVLSVFNMLKNSVQVENDFNFFALNKYYLKAKVRIISNKNTNEYEIEEFYLNTNEDEKFRFLTKENDKHKMTYIINNNTLLIKNEDEKAEFLLSDYVFLKDNLLSLSTFANLYNDIKLNEQLLISKCIKLEDIITDNLIRYKISFLVDDLQNHECQICNKYKRLLEDKIDVKKIELVYDLSSKKPIQYIVYSSKNEAILDMNILEFDINSDFDEKIFAF